MIQQYHSWGYTQKTVIQVAPEAPANFFCLQTANVLVHLFTCAYIVWVISLPFPFPPFPSTPPQFHAGPILPLSLILLKKKHKHNKKDKALFLVELRIAIQKDSYYCFMYPCVKTHVDSTLTDLYVSS
jgi:hypothetical protein